MQIYSLPAKYKYKFKKAYLEQIPIAVVIGDHNIMCDVVEYDDNVGATIVIHDKIAFIWEEDDG